jgi:hypothetical protein
MYDRVSVPSPCRLGATFLSPVASLTVRFELGCVAATLRTCVCTVNCSNLGWATKTFLNFLLLPQANAEIVIFDRS